MATQVAWMPATDSDYELLKGKQIVSQDGQRLGRITEIIHPNHSNVPGEGGHFFLFQPGVLKSWFGGLDEAYLPESTISGVVGDEVQIELTEEQIRQRRWDMPAELEGYIRS